MKVLIRESPKFLGTDKRTVRKIIENLLASLKLPDRDLSILFVDNKKIRQLNKQYFHKDYPTNVISFSYMDGLTSEVIGDIVISIERTREEAESLSVPFYERLFTLIIHGLVHILGYDHTGDKNQARRMRYREKKLLNFIISHSLYQKLICR
ncbi:MAG TPA: rRNA maturation RNase YbeY [Syntrophorhabdus sp.]|jgi:rRNA maturation RNase YbeY|nr:rRNA maturation RNase YbeY [Syntrophorhabdus sp.]MDI9558758.1 rRNA maturation RNase YbeY [Pseudomonadota bacterium]HNQ45604.1 rRNA maturation RNase YbeY [Syntrophorhabdus sp.]HNS78102.1 rRNA maturation RNase YbeY [Syntrophorhabdus sp.]HNY69850.1 rRNA maturation RNase YbeY [Syntrophorhabdus sp.]